MNKTLSIGLAGFSFTIEEHAYIKLNDYLAALRRSMEPEEANEVMQDIEMRIVEIFKSRLGKREVVNDEDVEAIIALIGTPEQIDEQEQERLPKKRAEAPEPAEVASAETNNYSVIANKNDRRCIRRFGWLSWSRYRMDSSGFCTVAFRKRFRSTYLYYFMDCCS